MDYHSGIQKNELLHATKWMGLKCISRSERSYNQSSLIFDSVLDMLEKAWVENTSVVVGNLTRGKC